eukprot:TRINITY_DN10709_c0_g1_i1.p1 TRINITY_DN10709_c0_g1~~TRINITY_DN10709_c0_g1_i1.p1  ORF type:complete len:684 (-),score=86.40 TRINITY_DN10709_c0_g1_i1:524-2485(-)
MAELLPVAAIDGGKDPVPPESPLDGLAAEPSQRHADPAVARSEDTDQPQCIVRDRPASCDSNDSSDDFLHLKKYVVKLRKIASGELIRGDSEDTAGSSEPRVGDFRLVLPLPLTNSHSPGKCTLADSTVTGGLMSPISNSNAIEDKLLAGMRAQSAIRFKVSGTMLGLGLTFGVCGQFFCLADHAGQHHWWATVAWLACVSSMWTLSLAPLPGDRVFTQAVLAACASFAATNAVCSYFRIMDYRHRLQAGSCSLKGQDVEEEYCRLQVLSHITYCSIDAIFCVFAACVGVRQDRSMSTQGMQVRMRRCIAGYLLVMIVVDILYMPFLHEFVGDVRELVLHIPPEVLAYVAISQAKVRMFVQNHIRALFEARGAAAAAAGLASLVGDVEISDAIAQAKRRFRGIRLEELNMEDFISSAVCESERGRMFERSWPVRLGHCDAFISHSWHDDLSTKWHAVQAWRSNFYLATNREPTIWFDKACINQSNIEADLRYLPIFVSGCKELLIFCGRTYLKRLWCIMEVFTFVHMGGNRARIKLIPLCRPGQEAEDRDAIRAAFQNFDVRDCECVVPSDRDNILTLIEYAFGGTWRFNKLVRNIFEEVGFEENLDSLSESSEMDSAFSSLSDSPVSDLAGEATSDGHSTGPAIAVGHGSRI